MSEATTSLVSKSCTPCRGGIPPLTPEEVEGHHRQTPAWDVQDDSHRIEHTLRFKSFAEAFAFVRRVADLAEVEGLWLGLLNSVFRSERAWPASEPTKSI